jgi:hypothetical protein
MQMMLLEGGVEKGDEKEKVMFLRARGNRVKMKRKEKKVRTKHRARTHIPRYDRSLSSFLSPLSFFCSVLFSSYSLRITTQAPMISPQVHTNTHTHTYMHLYAYTPLPQKTNLAQTPFTKSVSPSHPHAAARGPAPPSTAPNPPTKSNRPPPRPVPTRATRWARAAPPTCPNGCGRGSHRNCCCCRCCCYGHTRLPAWGPAARRRARSRKGATMSDLGLWVGGCFLGWYVCGWVWVGGRGGLIGSLPGGRPSGQAGR